jgi:cell division protein FtsX
MGDSRTLWAGYTVSELLTTGRRETRNQFRLLGVLSLSLVLPVLLVALAMMSFKAASNLEQRRYLSAFAIDNSVVETLKTSLLRHPEIAEITVIPANESAPAILEIQPGLSLSVEQISTLASHLENSGNFNFVAVNDGLVQRNSNRHSQAKKFGVLLIAAAIILAMLICMLVVRRELLRHNQANINLQRQLGATATTISRPYVYRAALITAMSTILAVTAVTILNKTLKALVDISSYNAIWFDSLPISYLILLGIVSVIAASIAAATTFQSIFQYINQIVRGFLSSFQFIGQEKFAPN